MGTITADRAVLRAIDVVKHYGDETAAPALAGVSLDIEAGDFVAVMGPSGSGKSTLLHLLGGLDAPTSGTIEVDGVSLDGCSDNDLTMIRRDRVGFVFQSFNLVPVLDARGNVALPGVIAGKDKAASAARATELLDLVGLADRAHARPSELSGGQQQRVAIARAMFMEPAVLLADEPTGNLDSRTSAEVLGLLATMRAELSQTIVLVTHDPIAAGRAERVIFLRDGLVAGDRALHGDHHQRTGTVLEWLAGLEDGASPTRPPARTAKRPAVTKKATAGAGTGAASKRGASA